MTDAKKVPDQPTQVIFHYLKAAAFRTIHVDGAIGALTPQGGIHFALYSERPAIPQQVTYQVRPDGALGEQEAVVSRGGVVRELEVDAIMTLDTAKSLRDWLSRKLSDAEKFVAETGTTESSHRKK